MKEMEECLKNIKQKQKKSRENCRWWPKGAFFPILVVIKQREKRVTTKKRNSNNKNQVFKNEHVEKLEERRAEMPHINHCFLCHKQAMHEAEDGCFSQLQLERQ